MSLLADIVAGYVDVKGMAARIMITTRNHTRLRSIILFMLNSETETEKIETFARPRTNFVYYTFTWANATTIFRWAGQFRRGSPTTEKHLAGQDNGRILMAKPTNRRSTHGQVFGAARLVLTGYVYRKAGIPQDRTSTDICCRHSHISTFSQPRMRI